MTEYLETLAPVEFVFLVSALIGALGLLITTVWLAIAGGFGLPGGKDPEGNTPPKRVMRIVQAVDGFTKVFLHQKALPACFTVIPGHREWCRRYPP